MRYLKLHPILENSLNRPLNDPDFEILSGLKEILNFVEDDYNISVADYKLIEIHPDPTGDHKYYICHWDLDGTFVKSIKPTNFDEFTINSLWNVVFRGWGDQFSEIFDKIEHHIPMIRQILGLDLEYTRSHFYQQDVGYRRLSDIDEITDSHFILTLNFKKR